MSQSNYKFDFQPQVPQSIIKVIGVGGGGSNAVNHMYRQGIQDVEFIVCNTDAQALQASPVPNKLQVGSNLTEGLGAGANPEKGRNAAIESKEEVRELLDDGGTKMLFITAGMGGGTGTGAAPEIAKVASEQGILTVGIVTCPFSFEGPKKRRQAMEGIDELRKHCDSVLVILNEKLREVYGNLKVSNAFAQADNILTTAAKGIAEIITVEGYVNVDFEDVRTVMTKAGAAVMGSAKTEGENRSKEAAQLAITSPLLNDRSIHGAQRILVNTMSGEEAEISMEELTTIMDFIQEQAGENAEVIFGHGIDNNLGQSISVTIIATGFDSENIDETPEPERKRVIDLESNKSVTIEEDSEYSRDQDYSQKSHESGRDNEKAEEEKEEEKVYHSLDDSNSGHYQHYEEEEDDSGELSRKRERLKEQSKERSKKLRESKGDPRKENADELKEKMEQPAYVRKNVKLSEPPHSSERNVSRYNLNDEKKLMGNNRFLHDNVD